MRFFPSRQFLLKVTVLLSSTLFALLAAEIGLRFWTSETHEVLLQRAEVIGRLYFERDPDLGLRRRADVDLRFRFEEHPSGFIRFRTNNLGLRRTIPTSKEKPAGTDRVLILGDSHLDGVVNPEENLAFLLETRLGSAGRSVEVLNAATGSYSPYQSYLWYQKFGRVLEPDLVIFSIYLGNDFAELLAEGRPRLLRKGEVFQAEKPTQAFLETMTESRPPSLLDRLDFFLFQKSILYAQVSGLLRSGEAPAEGPLAEAYSACLGCTAQSLGQIAWFQGNAQPEEAIRILAEILRRIEKDLRSRGGRVLLLLIPTRRQVEPQRDLHRIQEVSRILGLEASDLEIEDRLGAQLKEVGRELGIMVVDPITELRKTEKPVYYDTDWHLNGLGHRIVAEVLLQRPLL